MDRQPNTLLYVVGASVACIIGIVIAVRAISPEERWTEATAWKPLQQTSPFAKTNSNKDAGLGSDDRVQTFPITVGDRQGWLVRYQVDKIDEQQQQRMAISVLRIVKADAERAGVEVIVVVADVQGRDAGAGSDGGSDTGSDGEQHLVVFENTGGTWAQVKDPKLDSLAGSVPRSLPGFAEDVPSPAASGSPLIIKH